MLGLLPIPEIQYLAYLHNAEDQLRGEAATLAFFSDGQYRNPLVVRIAGYGYQKGFGGHFHNDNSVAVLRDIPGLVIASPATPATTRPRCCAPASRRPRVDGTVCVFLEPIALYHTRDLHEPGDGAAGPRVATRGGASTCRSASARTATATATTCCIVSSANGLCDVAARGAPPRARRGHRVPRARPAVARAAAGRRPGARGRRRSAGC